MIEPQYPCYYPGEYSPPTKMHLNTVHWLLQKPEIAHVHIVIGKDVPGQPTQEQKAKLWELLLKSKFAPQASIIKSKENGPVSEIYETFNKKKTLPGFIALDEKASRNKKFQSRFECFPYYGIQLVPSQYYKSSKSVMDAIQSGDDNVIRTNLPEDFTEEMIEAYIKILKAPEPSEVQSKPIHINNYKEQYTKMFDDGFWKSVFQPMSDTVEINEAMSDSAKEKALKKFKSEKPEMGDAQIKYYINKFSEKGESSVFKKKDIFQYKFDELEKLIDANFSSDSYSDKDDDIDFKGSEDVVYNDNGLLILLGDLKEKCIRYGKGYSWCISRKDTSNMFFSYRMRLNEPVFYFVFDEDKPKDDKYHAMVIYINSQGEYYVANSLNTGDKKMSWSEIESIQPKLKGLKKLFKHVPLTADERKDYERFKDGISDEEYDKLTYTDKEKYIGFSHDLTEKQIRSTPKDLVSKYATTTAGENIPEDIEKSLSPSDQKKLKENRIEKYGDAAKFIYYPNDLKPEDLSVDGDLDLSNTPIESLPDNLQVGGYLFLRYTKIKSLPDNLKVDWGLDLADTPIESLPDNLQVGRSLNLTNCKNLKSLPDNLQVGGSLNLTNCKNLKFLPDNLQVGKDLILRGTSIKSLPDNLKVDGDIHGSPDLKKQWEEIKAKRNQK